MNAPVVLTRKETAELLTSVTGTALLIAKLIYGSGVRISEAVRLRVHDIDYDMKALTVRSGKGNKDRVTTFPDSLVPLLKNHLAKVKLMHECDLKIRQIHCPKTREATVSQGIISIPAWSTKL